MFLRNVIIHFSRHGVASQKTVITAVKTSQSHISQEILRAPWVNIVFLGISFCTTTFNKDTNRNNITFITILTPIADSVSKLSYSQYR
jgi:hypothetical protein